MNAAIVTGASGGLGAALVDVLLAEGWHVAGVARTRPPAARESYRFLRGDLGDVAGIAGVVQPLFDAIAAEHPLRVCLVNNAATITGVGVVGTLDPADVVASLNVNLVAPCLLADLFCRTFGDEAVERRIVNVSSGAAQSTLAGESLYCVAKAGLEMLTKSIAAERASASFHAVTIRPGIIDTPMQAFARAQTKERLPSVDLFKGFHDNGLLVPADVVARKIVGRLVDAPVENGRTYSYAEL
ncbi:MAG: SDR family NAD(P)-dependent oxidoreductase [Betaproteobacteria bacterium]